MVKMKGLRTKDERLAVIVARENGISMAALVGRLQRGWSIDDACTVPPGASRQQLEL